MKNSKEPSMDKDDDHSSVAPEESSWTFYFEQFLCQNDEHMIMSCNEALNSLVSDAASSAIVKKVACIQDHQAAGASCKKLRFKKRKTLGVMIDDSLEDTASSPVNSPKVAYFDQMKMKNKNENKNKEILHFSKEKIDTCEEEEKEEENKREFNVSVNDSNMELKKRGLCLVPLSSLANFLKLQ